MDRIQGVCELWMGKKLHLYFNSMFLSWDSFVLFFSYPGRLILETFLVITTGWEGTVGIKWIEGRDASKKIPTTKSCPVQNVNSAMVEINPALTGF